MKENGNIYLCTVSLLNEGKKAFIFKKKKTKRGERGSIVWILTYVNQLYRSVL